MSWLIVFHSAKKNKKKKTINKIITNKRQRKSKQEQYKQTFKTQQTQVI